MIPCVWFSKESEAGRKACWWSLVKEEVVRQVHTPPTRRDKADAYPRTLFERLRCEMNSILEGRWWLKGLDDFPSQFNCYDITAQNYINESAVQHATTTYYSPPG